MKFLPVVALMEAMSPICSITVAMAMGMMVKRAEMNSGLPSKRNRPISLVCRGRPNQAAWPMASKFTAPMARATR